MVTDYWRKTLSHTLVNIQGLDIEVVDSFKYIGVHLNHKLDSLQNTSAIHYAVVSWCAGSIRIESLIPTAVRLQFNCFPLVSLDICFHLNIL